MSRQEKKKSIGFMIFAILLSVILVVFAGFLIYQIFKLQILPDNIYNNKVFNNIRIVYKKEILYGENVECYYEEQNNKHIITAKSQDNINAIIELS